MRELDLTYNHPGESGVKLLSDLLEKLQVDHGGKIRMKPVLKKYRFEHCTDLHPIQEDEHEFFTLFSEALQSRQQSWRKPAQRASQRNPEDRTGYLYSAETVSERRRFCWGNVSSIVYDDTGLFISAL
ncbi:hypothetical protein MHYP_G00252020 [Metynnis hypsauchen]